MPSPREDCCILNTGNGSWAFEGLAHELSKFLGIDVAERPRRFNYLLFLEDSSLLEGCHSFVPIKAIRLASDKRLLATVFNEHHVPIPETKVFEEFNAVQNFICANSSKQWCLKYPTSCGANGHRLLNNKDAEPANWPRPFVVQEFIHLEPPEVYRTYCAGGELFGWVARRFPGGTKPSPWVAHARGARYEVLDRAPTPALASAKAALVATGLFDSFGCVDLLKTPKGEWVVLEAGTDGLFNHVDREVGDLKFEREINNRISMSFWCSIHDLSKA